MFICRAGCFSVSVSQHGSRSVSQNCDPVTAVVLAAVAAADDERHDAERQEPHTHTHNNNNNNNNSSALTV